MSDIDFIPTQPHGQQGRFPIFGGFSGLKTIQKIILTKILDKLNKMYYISIRQSIRQRGKPRRRGENPMGFRDSDSLLHSLSSGLWTPKVFWFRMPNFFFSFPSFRGIRKHRRETGGVFYFLLF